MARYAPIHAGEILKIEFLDGLGITQYVLSRDAGIDKGMLSRIVHGKSSISAETALRLATYFGTSADSWMNLQSRYDLEVAKDRAFKQIQRDVRSTNLCQRLQALTAYNLDQESGLNGVPKRSDSDRLGPIFGAAPRHRGR